MAKDITERVRQLRAAGMPEEDAIRQAAAPDPPDELDVLAEDDDTDVSEPDTPEPSDRQFVIVTKDFSGLGWAKKLTEEGETVTLATDYTEEDDPKLRKMMREVGTGWLDVRPLSEVFHTLRTDSTYWIFSENAFTKEADALREAGQKVFGTTALSERMEHDREYALEIADEAGLPSMPHEAFTTRQEGLAFLDAHANTAYVFKPDDGATNYTTFVPIRKHDADANREVYEYLAHMKGEPGSYVLQERIPLEDATEVNCEVWLQDGEPFLAFLGLEVKRKNTYDLGEMAGCGGDFVQKIPVDCALVQQTVGKMLPFYREHQYTGFADVNVIFTKDGTPHFLEVCNRFGYSAHVTMFLALATDTFGNVIADYMDGHIADLADRFRDDIGTSLTIFLDHPREGLPVHVAPEFTDQFYPFDGYKDDESDTLLLTGYSIEVGIAVDHGKTLEAAAKKVLDAVIFDEVVSVPDMHYRMDLGSTDYYNAPVLRYRWLQTHGLLS